MNKKFAYCLFIPVLAFMGLACSGDDPAGPGESAFIRFSVQGLLPLKNGFHYEGWALIGGSSVSTGKFNVDNSQNIFDLEGNATDRGKFETSRDLTGATEIVVTIEPDGDSDGVPSNTRILAGNVSGSSASLTVAHTSALGNDFIASTGTYILATPTDGADTNENSGIWFLDPSGESAVAGLQLPTLPAGWRYEGCVVMNGIPVTTGKFTSVDNTDTSAPYSGTQEAPPFPGEDFLFNAPEGLTFPTDLSGVLAVITVEPFPDDDTGPSLHLFVGTIPANATDRIPYELINNVSSFPTATVTIRN